MCISRLLWKLNAVITVVTPCKYVSPQMHGWNETGAGNSVGKEESEGRDGDRHYICSLTFQQWKVHEQQKWRFQIFWLSAFGNATDALRYYFGFLCLRVVAFFMNCICGTSCFLCVSFYASTCMPPWATMARIILLLLFCNCTVYTFASATENRLKGSKSL